MRSSPTRTFVRSNNSAVADDDTVKPDATDLIACGALFALARGVKLHTKPEAKPYKKSSSEL